MSDNVQELNALIDSAINNKLIELRTCTIGIIQSFNADNQTAEIQPAINRIFASFSDSYDVEQQSVNTPLLINVPVSFPKIAGHSITKAPTKGDECIVIFSDRSIDNWFKNSGTNDPSALRKHDLSDAIAIIGISSEPNKITDFQTDTLEIRNNDRSQRISLHDDKTITVKSNQNIVIQSSEQVTIDCKQANINASDSVNITSPISNFDGDINCTGTVTSDKVMANSVEANSSLKVANKEINNHKHLSSSSGNPTSGNL